MKKVDFFIIGAPKCGTDSLRDYLNLSPEIFMSGPQEPNYFCTDIQPNEIGIKDYFNKYYGKAKNEKLIGEKSTWYLASKEAPKACIKYNPDAKFIVVVRDPLKMFISLHSEVHKLGVEKISNPYEAWIESMAKNPIELKGNKKYTHYSSVCKLGEQVAYWQDLVGKDRILIVNFDDLISSDIELARICKFLNVANINNRTLPTKNQAVSGELTSFGKILRPSQTLIKCANSIKRVLGISSFGLGNYILDLQRRFGMKPYIRPKLTDKQEAEIRDFFQVDIKILAKRTGIDFSSWLNQ